MAIIIGLLIIAIGALCQSSSYVPINKIKSWSWESYWLVQSIFAFLLFPLIGANLAVPEEGSLCELFSLHSEDVLLTFVCGILWGIGGLSMGLSMRYLGVALGQSIALGTCAALGTVLAPLLLGQFDQLNGPLIAGVVATLIGIGVIGKAGMMKNKQLNQKGDDTENGVKEFNLGKGIVVALLCGITSACFNLGLELGKNICYPETAGIFRTLPATLIITSGGFLTNLAYCLYQNHTNRTWSDYGKKSLYVNNIVFCALAGILWYSQFFGLSLGKSFLQSSATLLTFSWCILMACNVVFSNLWGIVLKEWKGCKQNTIVTLVVGLVILILSTFLPELLK